MRKYRMKALAVCLGALCLWTACGESSEDVSFGLDHEVPQYSVLTDSLQVSPLQEVVVKVNISDNEGLKKLVFEYGSWNINEAINLPDFPKSYSFEWTITVPADAEKEWDEQLQQNDGSIISVRQTYHTLTITATDINMNVKKIPIYIRVL